MTGAVKSKSRVPTVFWRLLRLPPRLLYAIGLGRLYGRFVLLLTTTGRRSGLPRVTPLQYEEIDGAIYVASARGIKADWFRNILANPHVQVRLKSHQIHARAEPVTEPERIADFLELRLRRHPRMVGAMMRSAGLPPGPDRQQLEAYAANRAMVILRPVEGVEEAGTARAQTGQNGWPNACQLAGRLEQHLAQPIEVITQGHEDEGLPLFLQYSPEE